MDILRQKISKKDIPNQSNSGLKFAIKKSYFLEDVTENSDLPHTGHKFHKKS